MNIIVQLQFELTYYDVTVQHISHYARGTSLEHIQTLLWELISLFKLDLSDLVVWKIMFCIPINVLQNWQFFMTIIILQF